MSPGLQWGKAWYWYHGTESSCPIFARSVPTIVHDFQIQKIDSKASDIVQGLSAVYIDQK